MLKSIVILILLVVLILLLMRRRSPGRTQWQQHYQHQKGESHLDCLVIYELMLSWCCLGGVVFDCSRSLMCCCCCVANFFLSRSIGFALDARAPVSTYIMVQKATRKRFKTFVTWCDKTRMTHHQSHGQQRQPLQSTQQQTNNQHKHNGQLITTAN